MVDLNDCFASVHGRLTIAEAMDRFISGMGCVVESEEVLLADALGRILAGDLTSEIQIPPHNNSAVDGYLVCLDDLENSNKTSLPVAGRIAAGYCPRVEPIAHRGAALQQGTRRRHHGRGHL